MNFTGSTHVGRIVAQLRGEAPEAGAAGARRQGAAASCSDDADLDEAVSAAAFGAFFNQGQICMSTERIVVDASVADAFVEQLGRESRVAFDRRSQENKAPLGSMVELRGRRTHRRAARRRAQQGAPES